MTEIKYKKNCIVCFCYMSTPYKIHTKILYDDDPLYRIKSFPVCYACLEKLKNMSVFDVLEVMVHADREEV